MIPRELAAKISELIDKFPIVAITGPRQSGKTTLSKMLKPDYKYVNLENLSDREFAKTDPTGFLETYKNGVIIDEIQNVPSLFSYLQVVTDERNTNGEYIITGSQNFLMMEQIAQSLAGRVTIFSLLPLSYNELKNSTYLPKTWESYALSGSYPRKIIQDISASDYYDNYIKTYIERDVRLLKNINNLDLFQKFIKLIAGRVGQLFNQTSLGNELDLDNKTINSWFSLLETSFIAFRLQPYHSSFNKRIVKTSKIYFYDTGLLAYLLGIRNENDLENHFAKGSIFENLAISELKKNALNGAINSKFFFWRDHSQNEVDVIMETGMRLDAIEIKSGKTIRQDFFKGLDFFKSLNSKTNLSLIYGGSESQERTNYTVNTIYNLPVIKESDS
ncbi:ATP-binding protein [Flavobacterium restrictum]|uniref:ATP-binding protein n=1 Tax=Flavobacterium restrictum TaxID=2594428 RepID=A0A553E657_9FLAO|nr:ATP-binding protein [Flavobacterium restrictum]TRX40490.1 ATP-binding protein [Flavobacterium restrictum]